MDTTIESLGEPRIDSPLKRVEWVDDDEQVLFDISPHKVIRDVREGRTPVSFMKAGPRQKIFFDPSKLKCAMVTCGGLCPGLNDVIRSLVSDSLPYLRRKKRAWHHVRATGLYPAVRTPCHGT